MKNDILLKITVGGFVAAGCFLVGDKLFKKVRTLFIESQEEKRIREEEYEKEVQEYNEKVQNFRDKYSEREICDVTLSNTNIKSKEDKSYLYDKLKTLRDNVVNCSFSRREEFNNKYMIFMDLFNILYDMDADTIEAKIISMRNEDKAREDRAAIAQKEYEAEQKHRRELEVIEENRKKDVEVYKAKIGAEQVKLKTLCKAMEKADKNIQSTLNIKTSISED